MKHAAAAICIMSQLVIAASAHTIPAETHSLEALFDNESKEAARDAILVGQILRNAARHVTKGGSNHIPTEEYSFRTFWNKVVAAINKAAAKVKDVLKEIGDHLKEAVKDVAIAVGDSALNTLKKATEKAIEIMVKVFEKTAVNYSSQDSQNNGDIVKELCARMDLVGKKLIEQGKKILTQ